ncbi:MAG: glycoside hydrolase family 10 protein [bacterium]
MKQSIHKQSLKEVIRLILGLIIFVGLLFNYGITASIKPEGKRSKPKEVRAIWLWSSFVKNEGANTVAAKLAKYGISDVFLLVKGMSGEVMFKSKFGPPLKNNRDILQEMIPACHKRGIKVHAWIIFQGDMNWGKTHPQDVVYHAGNSTAWNTGPYSRIDDTTKQLICPLVPEYREYIKNLIGEVVDTYKIGSIHLDVIRYAHVVYCFCPRHQQKAKELGINLEHVREVMYRSLYTNTTAQNLYVERYKAGDPDIMKWVAMRQNEITSLVKEIRELIDKKHSQMKLSAAFVPEGGEEDDSYALCYFAQNYRELGKYLDFICPMTYHKEFRKPIQWVVDIAKHTEEETGKPVYAGIQAFSEKRSIDAKELSATIKAIRDNNIPGFVLFRYGSLTDEMWNVVK